MPVIDQSSLFELNLFNVNFEANRPFALFVCGVVLAAVCLVIF